MINYFLIISIVLLCFENRAFSDFFKNENSSSFSNYVVVPKVKKEINKRQIQDKKISSAFKKTDRKIVVKKIKTNNIKTLKVSFEKFKKILLNHSFPEHTINTMWCIAHHESGFNPLAYNYNENKTFDVGLFQINQIWKRWCGMKDRELLDVSNNTRCALVVLKKQGLTAWVTYKKYCRGS